MIVLHILVYVVDGTCGHLGDRLVFLAFQFVQFLQHHVWDYYAVVGL